MGASRRAAWAWTRQPITRGSEGESAGKAATERAIAGTRLSCRICNVVGDGAFIPKREFWIVTSQPGSKRRGNAPYAGRARGGRAARAGRAIGSRPDRPQHLLQPGEPGGLGHARPGLLLEPRRLRAVRHGAAGSGVRPGP